MLFRVRLDTKDTTYATTTNTQEIMEVVKATYIATAMHTPGFSVLSIVKREGTGSDAHSETIFKITIQGKVA